MGCLLQTTTGELNKKQPVLSALGDIVSQLTKMADDSVMSAADESVKQLGAQLNELLEKMNGRKTYLQVIEFFFTSESYSEIWASSQNYYQVN
jgi:hypothetical protein